MSHPIETLTYGTKVVCSPAHRFGTDALLLARFCPPKRDWSVVDLCSGCGIVSLEWYDTGHRGACTAVEISPEGSGQLQQALQTQGITSITAHCGDLRTFSPPQQGQVQLVACNPPYFEVQSGAQRTEAAHAIARHENECTLTDVCTCAARLLNDGGRFVLCHRPARMAEVIATLQQHRLVPKRIAFVKHKAEGEPWLFLLEAQKNRKQGLRVLPDILMQGDTALF